MKKNRDSWQICIMHRTFIILVICLLCNYQSSASISKPDNKQLQETIRIVGDKACPPYEFINNHGKPDGFSVELISTILNNLGYKYAINLCDFSEGKKLLLSGKADLITGAVFTQRREDTFAFSLPHSFLYPIAVCRKESEIRSLISLNGKTILLQKGNIIAQQLYEQGIYFKPIYLDNIIDGLKKFANGDGDVLICENEVAINYLISTNNTNLEIRLIDIPYEYQCFMAMKKDKNLIAQINTELEILKDNGTYNKIYQKWLGVYTSKKSTNIFWIIISCAFLLFIISLLFIFLLNRQVKKALLKNSVADEKLNASTFKYKELYNKYSAIMSGLPIGIEIYDKDGRVTFINDKDLEIFGISDRKKYLSENHYIKENIMFEDDVKQKILEGQELNIIIDYSFDKVKSYNLFPTKFSNQIVLDLSTKCLRDAKGEIEAYIFLIDDITREHKANTEIKEISQYLDLVIEAGNIAVWGFDIKKDKITGIAGKSFIKEPLTFYQANQSIHPDDLDVFIGHMQKLLKGESDNEECILRIMNYDTGEYRWTQKNMISIKDSSGNVIKIIGTHKDIDSEVKSQKEKNDYISALSLAIKATNLFVCYYDVDKNCSYFIKDGSFQPSTITFMQILQMAHPDDKQTYQTALDAILNGKMEHFDKILRFKILNANEYGYYHILMVTEKENGKNSKIVGTIENVTDEVIQKQKLEESKCINEKNSYQLDLRNRELNIVLRAGGIIPLKWDSETDIVYITSNTIKDNYNVFDMKHDGLPLDIIIAHTHPDDREKTAKIFNDFRTKNILSEHTEIRYDFNNNYNKTFDLHLFAPDKTSGLNNNIFGYMQDITERKKSLIQLQQKEEFFKNVFDNIPIAIHIKSPLDNYRYIYWNRASTKLFGRDLTGEHISSLLIDEDAKFAKNIDEQVLNTKKHYSNYEKLETKNGLIIETIVDKTIIYDNNNPLLLIARWNVEEQNEMQRKAKILKLSLSNMYTYTWECNLSDNILRLSQDFDNLGGDSKHILNFNSFSTLIHPDYRQTFLDFFKDFATKKFGTFSVQYKADISNSGKYKWWESRGTIETKIENGKPVKHMFGIVLDITEHIEIANDLKKAKEKAEQSDKLKSAFLANMSHEIRTPLNAIVGFSSLLAECQSKQEKEEYLSIIQSNNDTLLSLIGDILDLSKIESGLMELKNETFELNKLFEEMLAVINQKNTNEQIKIIYATPASSPYVINGDITRIRQILTNYLTNALKYTVKGVIEMGFLPKDKGTEIYVKDTGIGIPKEKQFRVFTRFEKLDNFAKGNGLGLSICKAIATAMRGKVGFSSEQGKGSTFWAWFPNNNKLQN